MQTTDFLSIQILDCDKAANQNTHASLINAAFTQVYVNFNIINPLH